MTAPEATIRHPDGSTSCIRITPGDENLYWHDVPVMNRHWGVGPGRVVVDVGCGPGTWTLVALAAGARVHAFDPKECSRTLLRRQVELNGYEGLTLVPYGVWSHGGRLPFSANSYVEGAPESVTEVVSLDDYFYTRPDKVDAVNIDAEWAEREVVQGARSLLARDRPRLIIEVHDESYDADLRRLILEGWPGYTIARDESFMIAW